MTTITYTTVFDHSSDATFRAWGAEFDTKLALTGMVQTADTGQIDWVTVTRPGTSSVGGYTVWRFADSSLYLKLEYGTGTSTDIPQMWVTVGTGSNGSGTITGQTSTRSIWTAQKTIASAVTTYTTYMCHVADALSIDWKSDSNTSLYPMGVLLVGKTVDGAGAASSTGFGVMRIGSGSGVLNFQSVRTAATAATYTDGQNFALMPGNPSSSLIGADVQAFQIWNNVPNVQPWPWGCVYLGAEITKLNTFSVAMVAAVSHTYLAIGKTATTAAINGQGAGAYVLAMVYE